MDDDRGDFLDDLKDVKDSMNVSAVLEVINNKTQRAKSQSTAGQPPRRTTEPRAGSKSNQLAARSIRPKDSAALLRPGLQNITTRLSPDTTLLLKRMVLQQQLDNQKPDTRQDIIEVALREWARRHGYLRDTKGAELPSEEAQGGD